MCGATWWVSELDETQQLSKVSTPCIDDHHFKKKWNLLENCHKYALNLFQMFFLARIGRPDILWSVHKLARSFTNWTTAFDKHLNRLISYIHQTCEKNSIPMGVILHNNADWDCFKNSDLAGDLEDTKSTSGRTLCIFGCRTCVRISWMCKKQCSVSLSNRIRNHLFGR